MRNLKKFLALVLAMLMVVSAGATVSAYSDVAEDDAYAAAIAALTEYGIVNGTELGEAEDGSDALFEPDADVTRWQMALMMARALAPEVTNEEWAEGMEIFADVDQWYGAIAYAYVEGIVNGVSTESLVFKPNDGIKYQDGLIMALRALGYDVDVSGVVYWLDAWTQAKQIGLTDDIAISSGSKTMTRGEMAQLIYNMVQLPFADGSESLAIKYYGSEAPEVVAADTFVITATPKQAYVEGLQSVNYTGDDDTALVGLQKLEAGIPAGDIMYVPASTLGIDEDEIENYMHYAVNLYNYDEETGDYTYGAIVADPVIVKSYTLGTSGSYIKVGSYTYYPVDSITENAMKNEIVVFNGSGETRYSKILLKNSDGDIVDYDGSIRAKFAYSLGSTNYYVHEPIEDKTEVISESVALDLYGIKTSDNAVFTEYATLSMTDLDIDTTANKGTAYQLTMFDDNQDGKYDRAIYDTVYMSVYDKADGTYEDTVSPYAPNGNSSSATKSKTANVTYSDTSVTNQGTIFTYTYNVQTGVVNVIDILEPVKGVLTNVNLVDDDSSNNYKIVLTIGGNKYTLAHSNFDYLMGADLMASMDGAAYTGAFDYAWADIADDPDFTYTYFPGTANYAESDDLYEIGATIEFYAYNGYLITGHNVTPNEDADWTWFVSDGAYSYDSSAVYVDGYLNGKETTIEISALDDKTSFVEKDIAIADMNIFDLGEFLADAKEFFAEGNVFRVVAKDNGTYKLLSDEFIYTVGGDENNDVLPTAFDFVQATDDMYLFEDGVSEMESTKKNRIRTDDDTVFYFIKYNNRTGDMELNVEIGEPDDGDYIDTTVDGTYVYTDVLGWSRSKATVNGVERANSGVSNIVLVYYTSDAAIGGFNITTDEYDYTVVYAVPVDSGNTGLSIVAASEVDDSDEGWYYKMADNNAINMHTGALVGTIYSKTKIPTGGDFYRLDEDNVIHTIDPEKKANILKSGVVTAIDVDDNYVSLEVDGEMWIDGDDDEVTKIMHVDLGSYPTADLAVETNNNDSTAKDIEVDDTVWMLASANELKDGIAVIIDKDVVTVTYECECDCDECECTSTTGEFDDCKEGCECECCEEDTRITGKWVDNGSDENPGVVYVDAADYSKLTGYTFTVTWNGAADTFASIVAGDNAIDNVNIDMNTTDNTIFNYQSGKNEIDDNTYVITSNLNVAKDTLTFALGYKMVNGKVMPLELEAGNAYEITIGLNEESGVAAKQIKFVVDLTA